MTWTIRSSRVAGTADVPGDKSIGHRALIIGSLASGESTVIGLPSGEDVASTACCVRNLGVQIIASGEEVAIRPPSVLRPPMGVLDAGNSGTTMRLLAGVLSGYSFTSEIRGDESLSRRPMERIARPLRQMGARVETVDGHAPIHIQGRELVGTEFELAVASAQVKSAILLAGLRARGETSVSEPHRSRDHTERFFQATGVEVRREGLRVSLHGGQRPEGFHLSVPGDFSSAAFFFTAAAVQGTEVTVRNVGINETRSAFLRVLERMGARVSLARESIQMGEPTADVTVAGPLLRGAIVESAEVPALIDELSLVALLGCASTGPTIVRGAAELRVKETDRIATTSEGLSRMGASISATPDGFVVQGGGSLHGALLESFGDHRIAMMLAIAATTAEGETRIEGNEAAAISYPEFAATLRSLGGLIDAS